MNEEIDEAAAPPQWKPQPIYDFRAQISGPRGYKVNVTKKGTLGSKRKLDEISKTIEEQTGDGMEEDGDGAERHHLAARDAMAKRVKRNIVGLGKASGRTWKAPAERAGTLRNQNLSSSWEKKMRMKAEAQAFKTRKRDAIEAHKTAMKERRQKREEAKKRKEENQKKSAITQPVTAETAKRMSKNKKLKKKLVSVER
jgi:rRNA-processing protein CGR1